MNSNLNRGAWKKMENGWDKALNTGKNVRVNIKPIYTGASRRPDVFNVNYWIDGKKNTEFFKNGNGG